MSDGLVNQLRAEAEAAVDRALAAGGARARRAAVRGSLAAAGALFALVAAGFASAAAFIALAERFGAMEASLALGGGYGAAALLCIAFAARGKSAAGKTDAAADPAAAAPAPVDQARATLHAITDSVSDRASPRVGNLLKEGAARLPVMSGAQMALLAVAVGFVYARTAPRIRPRGSDAERPGGEDA